MVPLSILDLVPIPEGSNPTIALRNSLDLARHAERLGYTRYWVAEHHNSPGIASAATSVVIGYLAGGTSTIRVGSGGIMLPNHSPVVIAEQFGTLESLYPGRIDLGLGRAPGTDQLTIRAMRRSPMAAENFPNDVQELQILLGDLQPNQHIQAVPGTGTEVPLWILGSSTYGGQLAGILGLPYAFASHFAPDLLLEALDFYRQRFQPSKQLDRPYAMVGLPVIAADTDEEARYLFTSTQQSSVNMVRGRRGQLPPPIADIETYWTPSEKLQTMHKLQFAVVGSRETVREGLERVIAHTQADELMLVSAIYDHEARKRSLEIVAEAAGGLTGAGLGKSLTAQATPA
ncbi:MAG: LLM class flavin-dependent oxidoreductase [Chloroflexota bacterium]